MRGERGGEGKGEEKVDEVTSAKSGMGNFHCIKFSLLLGIPNDMYTTQSKWQVLKRPLYTHDLRL